MEKHDLPTERMDVDAFEAWLEHDAPPGRYELFEGGVVQMAAERMRHSRAETAALFALTAAARDLPCEAINDGMAVRIGRFTRREPDVALRCGDPLSGDATHYDDPTVLIEVTSPATATVDVTTKLIDYVRLPSLHHYLIVDTVQRKIIHQRRTAEGYATTILPGGALELDPPGLTLDLDAILAVLD